jgi:hypothetical protein
MVSTEDIDTLLTIDDLAAHLRNDLDRIGGDPRIVFRTEDDELIMTAEGFVRGLAIGIDTFGRWKMFNLISHEDDGEWVKTGDTHTTESIMTVFRTVAKWMEEARRPPEPVVRYRFALLQKEVSDT